MANRKNKIERGTFGAAPVLGTLPSVRGLSDDAAMFAAIGTIGGNMQWLVCSTMFFFGSLAKKKGEKYNGGKAWEAYYANSGLSYGSAKSKDNAKKDAVVYAAFAQHKKWDTQEIAGRIFEHPHGSQGQKAAAINNVMRDHPDKPPNEDELIKLLPKKKVDNEKAATIKQWAAGKVKAFKDVQTDDNLWTQIEDNATLLALFHAANTAIVKFSAMASTVTGANKNKAEKVANVAQLKAGLKASKAPKGAALN